MISLKDMVKITPYHYTKTLNNEYRIDILKFNTWRIELYRKTKFGEKLVWVCDGYDTDSKNKTSVIPGRSLWKDVDKLVKTYIERQ